MPSKRHPDCFEPSFFRRCQHLPKLIWVPVRVATLLVLLCSDRKWINVEPGKLEQIMQKPLESSPSMHLSCLWWVLLFNYLLAQELCDLTLCPVLIWIKAVLLKEFFKMVFVRLLSISFVEAQPELVHQVCVAKNYLFLLWVPTFALDCHTFHFFASPLISQCNLVCLDDNWIIFDIFFLLLVVLGRGRLQALQSRAKHTWNSTFHGFYPSFHLLLHFAKFVVYHLLCLLS